MKSVVFVDMDETLLHYDLLTGSTELRPGAIDALRELRKCADVYVFSAGFPDYVRDRLTEMRLNTEVDGAFSTWNYPGAGWIGRRKWVLLDNDPFLAEVKCEQIDPTGPCRWIEVQSFERQRNVVPLTAYLPFVWRAPVVNYRLFHGSPVKGLTSLRPSSSRSFPVIYFSDEPTVAASYTRGRGKVYPATVTMNHPFVMDAQGRWWEEAGGKGVSTDAIAYRAYQRGHDGVIIRNVMDEVDEEGYPLEDAPPNNIYAVFSPEQVKLMRRNPLSYENRFEPEPMKRYPRSRLVASLTAPPRQRAQEARMVDSPHRFRVVVVDETPRCRGEEGWQEHRALMGSLRKPGTITLVTDLESHTRSTERQNIYSAFTFLHRLGDVLLMPLYEIMHGSGADFRWASEVAEGSPKGWISASTGRAHDRLVQAFRENGIDPAKFEDSDWELIHRYVVTHTNSDMHRRGKVEPGQNTQSFADWIALTEMPSARARQGRGEPWLLFPPTPGRYAKKDERFLTAYAHVINTYFPPFVQSLLSDYQREGAVFDITPCIIL